MECTAWVAAGTESSLHGAATADVLVGHYVGSKPHGDPQVPNHGTPKRGPKLLPGLTITIEPMVNIGKSATRTLKDK